MLPTLLAAAGDTTVKEDLLKGRQGRRHELQGPSRRLQPMPPSREKRVAPQGFHLLDRRRQRGSPPLQQLEDHVSQADAEGFDVWQEPFDELRAPMLFNLRIDPFERAEHEAMVTTVVGGAHVPVRPGRRLCRRVAAELQGISATPEAGQLQPQQVMEAITKGAGDK